MKNFADLLIEAIKKKGSPICVGLDPRLDQLPPYIVEKNKKKYKETREAVAESILEFNKGIIDAVHDLVPIIKPQIAFYELFGYEGVRAFEETVKYAKEKGLLVISDAKRNDIGSTSEAYAKSQIGWNSYFSKEKEPVIGADAVTINAYFGKDGVKPFLELCDNDQKGIFVLVRTSNPSAGEVQNLIHENKTIYQMMGYYVDSWGADLTGENGYSSVGAVVGATYPKEAKLLREVMPNSYFLVPGYGAQGGGAEDVKPCFKKDGLGAIINSSRGITFAYQKMDFDDNAYAEASRLAVEDMKKDLAGVGVL